MEKTIKARGGKNGTLQAGQRKARFRRAFSPPQTLLLVRRCFCAAPLFSPLQLLFPKSSATLFGSPVQFVKLKA